MAEEKKFKDTLNLPTTDFPIRAGLNKVEPEILAEFAKADLYKLLLQKNAGQPKFILHDGPPYPNGDIHLGHALNKILKDIAIKYKNLQGFDTPYVPGWDCHGLPIEVQLLKKLREAKQAIPEKHEFREKCKEFALGYVENQKKQFQRLGITGNWDHPYLTLDPEYEAAVIGAFAELALNGYVYKGTKPIHWCPTCQTALAEAEIEYEDHRSPSIYMKFKIDGVQKTKKIYSQIDPKELEKLFPENQNASLIVWTTTPWTMPANVAVAVNPDFIYVVAKVKDELFVVAEALVAKVMEKFGFEYELVGKLKGEDLEGVVCRHPFIDRESPVVCAKYVTAEDGTGCVHIAPGHGQEDHVVGLEYQLPVLMPVDAKGLFTAEAGEFAGMHIDDANKAIVKKMEEVGTLLKLEFVKHSYPHCWRCKKPVIFRATPQWFIAMDQAGKHGPIREKALAAIRQTKWYPSWGENRIYAMIENRPDWCISRQRLWGVPIPVFYCSKCNEPQLKKEFLDAVIALVKKEGTNTWFIKEAKEILPAGTKCTCGNDDFYKEMDIMDVWLESGASQKAVLKTRPELSWPADLYLEGSDQHRGWFHSSLLLSIGENGVAPYKSVLTHGFTIDDQGRKMSKSLGNVVDANKTVDQYGADILRLWVASTDFKNDLAASPAILKQIQAAFSKIRNTWRFLLSNLYDYDEKNELPLDKLLPLDRWIISRLQQLLVKATGAYENYEYHLIFHGIHDFCANDLSALYLDINKDNLYTNRRDSLERRSCQRALKEMLLTMVRIMTPVLSFTCEDIYKYIKKVLPSETLPFAILGTFPKADQKLIDEALDKKYTALLKLKDEVYKVLEKRRAEKVIAASLEAKVILTLEEEKLKELDQKALESVLIVSELIVKTGTFNVEVTKADGEKCVRCWKYFKELNSDKLCTRCAAAIS